MDAKLREVVARYLPRGSVYAGSELRLPPHDTLSLVEDLERLGILIDGLDPWTRVGDDFAELPAGGFDTRDVTLNAAEARNLIKRWINDAGIDLIHVSFEGEEEVVARG